MIITIDGPTASGKSTCGRLLAKRLGYYYLYSGLLFRALAYLLVNKSGYKEDDLKNPRSDDVGIYLNFDRLVYQYDSQFQERIFFNKIDITPGLKTSFIDKMASILSLNEPVRKLLDQLQHTIVQRQENVVIDSRNAGSAVFPNALVKFFFTTPLKIRAERWRQGQSSKEIFSLEEAMHLVNERDKRDKMRAIDPFVVPDDALIIDNTRMSKEETVEKMLTLIQRKIKN